jgi:hypothetical protein
MIPVSKLSMVSHFGRPPFHASRPIANKQITKRPSPKAEIESWVNLGNAEDMNSTSEIMISNIPNPNNAVTAFAARF